MLLAEKHVVRDLVKQKSRPCPRLGGVAASGRAQEFLLVDDPGLAGARESLTDQLSASRTSLGNDSEYYYRCFYSSSTTTNYPFPCFL